MKMKMPSIEEETTFYYLHVLKKIKKLLDLGYEEGKPINYAVYLYPQLKDWWIPDAVSEQRILQNFITKGVITEVAERTDFQIGVDAVGKPTSAGVYYYLVINRDKFLNFLTKYKVLAEKHRLSEETGNTLIFHKDGTIVYFSPTGEKHSAKLSLQRNAYKMLDYMVSSDREGIFKFSELGGVLNKPREHAQDSSNERRVRDTIQGIKKALNYSGDDLFVVDKGFGIKCDIHIIR
ncbi:MAG: hypothetical protein ACD_22C00047G0009 [uncultured bacterium]|nr:MAG: hypothetical protein ACD_22C00047G0009 [uncultured bacterium]